jgi:hypothetical protein
MQFPGRGSDPCARSPGALFAPLLGCFFFLLPALAGPFELPGIRPDPTPFLLWDQLLTLRTAGGAKDNALLAAFNPQQTPLAIFGVEYFLHRLPVDANSVTFFFSGDERRYLRPATTSPGQPDAPNERTLLSHLSLRHDGIHLSPGITFTHLAAEQVFDATDLGGLPGTVRASGHSFMITPALRYRPVEPLFLEAAWVANRQLFKSPVSSYWESGPRLTLGCTFSTNSSVELSFQYTDRPFDSRLQTDPLGEPLFDTRLSNFDSRYEIAWRQTWLPKYRLNSTLRAFHLQRLENGEGFTDYSRIGGSFLAQAELGPWAFRALARWSTFDFDLQIVSVFDPVPRTRVVTDFEGRLEYRWTQRFRTYAEFIHERQDSNVAADRYRANTWQLGAEIDF